MTSPALPLNDLEAIYDSLAEAITRAGVDKEAVFLTKLVLLLAHEVGGDKGRPVVEQAIQEALRDL